MMQDDSNQMMKSGSSDNIRRRMSHGSLVGLKTIRCLDDVVDECSETLASSVDHHEVDNTIDVSGRRMNRRRSSRITRRSISIGESRMSLVDPLSLEKLQMLDGSSKGLQQDAKNARRRKSDGHIMLSASLFSPNDLLAGEDVFANNRPYLEKSINRSCNRRRRKSDGLHLLPSSIEVVDFNMLEDSESDDNESLSDDEGAPFFSDSDISVDLDLSELSVLDDSSNDDENHHCSKKAQQQDAAPRWRRTTTL